MSCCLAENGRFSSLETDVTSELHGGCRARAPEQPWHHSSQRALQRYYHTSSKPVSSKPSSSLSLRCNNESLHRLTMEFPQGVRISFPGGESSLPRPPLVSPVEVYTACQTLFAWKFLTPENTPLHLAIDLSQRSLSPQAKNSLVEVLKKVVRHVAFLTIVGADKEPTKAKAEDDEVLAPSVLQLLFKALKGAPITGLRIENCRIGGDELALLKHLIFPRPELDPSYSPLRHLAIINSSLPTAEFNIFIGCLKGIASKLETLDFTRTPLNHELAESLSSVVQGCESLHYFFVAYCGLDRDGTKLLVDAILVMAANLESKGKRLSLEQLHFTN
jgi:hypothetical protein